MELYVGGDITPKVDFDEDRFGYFDLIDEVKKLGYDQWSKLTYKIPRSMKMVDIRDDKDVMVMLSHLELRTRILNVYIIDGTQSGVGKLGVEDPRVRDQGVGEFTVGDPSMEEFTVGDPSMKKLTVGDPGVEEFTIGDPGVGKFSVGDLGVGAGARDRQGQDEGAGQEEGESNDEMIYIPSSDEEDETDDEMYDELVSDDEYTQAREKLKQANVRVISNELFTGAICDFGESNAVVERGGSDNEESDDDVVSDSTDEEDESAGLTKRRRRCVYNPRCDHKTLKLTLGMRFVNGYQVRDALTDNAIENGWEIHFKRVNEDQVEAGCKEPCKWKCYASKVNKYRSFEIKNLHDVHTCSRNMKSKLVTSNWIAKKYLNTFRLQPDTTIKELRRDLVQRYAHDASKWKLYNAKKKIIELLTGSVEDHYAKLRSYVSELMKVDKEGRFEIDVEIGSVFKSIYIGFSGLRKGFMGGCRRVIGLDGAFLKTYLGGVLLSAIGSDGNNQMFPIAWAVVQVENEVNWKWFIGIMAQDLNLGEGVGITIISDQQKVCTIFFY